MLTRVSNMVGKLSTKAKLAAASVVAAALVACTLLQSFLPFTGKQPIPNPATEIPKAEDQETFASAGLEQTPYTELESAPDACPPEGIPVHGPDGHIDGCLVPRSDGG